MNRSRITNKDNGYNTCGYANNSKEGWHAVSLDEQKGDNGPKIELE
jgi:hypothetical protein